MTISILPHPWTHSPKKVSADMQVAVEQGLKPDEVKQRQQKFGPNRLRQAQRRKAWQILVDQFKSLVVVLLVIAAGVSLAFGEWIDSGAIAVVVLINAALGFFTEMRAVRSMEALREMGSVTTKVRRNGQIEEIPAEELVPGDIVVVDGGDVVTADLRLIEASKLQANESALTGESVPVSKQVESLAADVTLAERSNMLFKGTAVTRGSGAGVVVATGMETELGQISALVEEAQDESTPLEERLDNLGRKLIWITLAIAAVVAVVGILRGKEILLMIETSIALAVAAIPEGLPIVATIALARGMQRMARRNALVNKLAAVETLGGTNVICADKTGTLTENQMTVTKLWLPLGQFGVSGEGLETEGDFSRNDELVDPHQLPALREAIEVGVLCNNASLNTGKQEISAVGDPVEVALLAAGLKAGFRRDELLADLPEEREEAFDADVKMMGTFHRRNGQYRVAVKGAPEAVLEHCTHIRQNSDEVQEISNERREEWLAHNREMAENGLRVLALAAKNSGAVDDEPYQGLTFLGLVGFLDPPRDDVRAAIKQCHQAGIKVVMVTGDQPVTARNVARAVGLLADDAGDDAVIYGKNLKAPDELSAYERRQMVETLIFARVSPKQKLDLIDLHQNNGAIVAMTGDGVNDAPALKKANIGIAMGQRGTQVAREAADMVLKDDAFATIGVAVEQGRVIFDNIRKFVLFLLSCNISEIMTVALASFINAPLPILPLQILFLNLVTDVFPALALGVGEGDPHIMKRPPRDPQEPIMTRRHWAAIGGYGLLITVAVLGALALALNWLGMPVKQATTISFLTLALAQLWHVFNMRDHDSGLLRNEITRNAWVWGALVLCVALLLLAVYLPVLSGVLRVVDPGLNGWLLVLGMSVLPLVVGQILKLAGFSKV
ncbi:MAG: cation-translocating P-type ATPase [Anaerolineae bacterium]|nr:cation-translocating P-type ATPase [Anaerolineae bacterium]